MLTNVLDFPEVDFDFGLVFFLDPFFASGFVMGTGAKTSYFSSSACFLLFLFADFFLIGVLRFILLGYKGLFFYFDNGLDNGFGF